MQRFWLRVAAADHNRKPWTFDELSRSAWPEAFEPGQEMQPSFKRSLRRALRKMVERGYIIPLGNGGPTDPHRYCINPMLVSAERRGELMTHLEPHGFYMDGDTLMIGHKHG